MKYLTLSRCKKLEGKRCRINDIDESIGIQFALSPFLDLSETTLHFSSEDIITG